MCVACGVERHAIAIEPVTARYEIRSDECPKCKTVVRLVYARLTTNGKRSPLTFPWSKSTQCPEGNGRYGS